MKVGGIVSGDPILRFTSRIPLSPIGFGLTVSVAFNLLALVAALGAGCLRTAGNVTGFIDQPSTNPGHPRSRSFVCFLLLGAKRYGCRIQWASS